jgi:hypothetical protein
MGMSTFVIGIKPPDDKWKKMKAARDSCIVADIPIPDEIDDFFQGEEPDEKGVLVYLKEDKCCSLHCKEGEKGYEIDLSKLPNDIKILRFVNSY